MNEPPPLTREISKAAKRIFASGNPYAPKFANDTIARTLLAPTAGSMLDSTQFDALGHAHAATGGGRVYVIPGIYDDLSFRPRPNDGSFPDEFRGLGLGASRRDAPVAWTDDGIYPIDFSDPQTYDADYQTDYRAYMSIESIIVPVSGAWGVLVAEYDYAVAAGSPEFIEALLNWVTLEPDEMVLILARRLEASPGIDGVALARLPGLLETIYGPAEAARLAALIGPYPGPR